MKNKILVLLSTYNGDKYLRKQLDTVLNQCNVDVNVLIRDDGSCDNTKNIISDYAKKNNNIKFIFGENLGYAKSFWNLICNASLEYDYYAFCDQDDIWLEQKLIKAIEKINNETEINVPVLYTSKVISVDNKMNIISENAFPYNKVLNIYESFQKSVVPGCTFVFNRDAIIQLKKYDGYMESHDWAAYCIINVFGKVIYDNNSYINYRIHSNNTIGKDNKVKKIIKKISRFFHKSTNARSKFAYDFYNTYKDSISLELKNEIKKLGYYRENIKYKFSLIISNKFKGIFFKIYIFLNRV